MRGYREVVCVGGDHDGRRVRIDERNLTFRIFDYSDTPPLFGTSGDKAVEITESTYVVMEFRSKGRKFFLARPPDQSEDATFALLMQGYRGV